MSDLEVKVTDLEKIYVKVFRCKACLVSYIVLWQFFNYSTLYSYVYNWLYILLDCSVYKFETWTCV